MKNLEVTTINRKPLQPSTSEASQIAVNGDTIFLIKDNNLHSQIADITEILSPVEYNHIIAFEYLTFENKLFIATSNGLVYYCPQTEDTITVPFEQQLAAAAWNSTQEVLAVVFSNAEVATYNVDHENGIARCLDKSSLEAKVPQTVYVGWGSADTQFRGSEGKMKTKVKSEVNVKYIEDKLPKITWRGNGEMFAINYWVNGTRTFKVYEQLCTPLYECEGVPGLQSCIAWRPEGNMIAVPVFTDDKYSIVIFEKNGYKRFQFDLEYPQDEVKELKWSPGGEILTVLQEDLSKVAHLSLYTASNYKWFLKQHLRFPPNQNLINFSWLSSQHSMFNLQVATPSEIISYQFKYKIHSSKKAGATLAVIDGRNVRLTPFEDVKLPPPLFDKTVSAEEAINFIALHDTKPILAVVDSEYNLHVFSCANEEVEILAAKRLGSGNTNRLLSLRNFVWSEDDLLCISNCEEKSLLNVVYSLGDGTKSIVEELDNRTTIIQVTTDKSIKLYQSQNIISLRQRNAELLSVTLPTVPLTTTAHIIANVPFVLSLTPTKCFYLNNKQIANNVTSFLVHDTYLLLTTTQNRIYCTRLTLENVKSLSLDDSFFSRPIEQGGLLVCAIPQTSVVILQIPRGNLEIISCRLIAIDLLESLLENGKWKEALNFIRIDRLNNNLLIDLNPSRFLNNIANFVDACETAALLNSVCQEIEDENVLNTIYAKCRLENVEKLENKRQIVCRHILDYLEEIDYANYISTIMIINVYHFTIEDALVYVQDLLQRAKNDNRMLSIAANAIKTLNIHAKREDLYQKSLSLYDVQLARYIAGFSQMDPKSYEPFLKELEEASEIERRFKINMCLKKPATAIRYLLRNENALPEETLRFIEVHKVAEVAYKNLTKDSPLFKNVSSMLGEQLHKDSLHEEAAVVYERASLFKEAFEEFRLACDWEKAVSCLNKAGWNDLERYGKLKELAEELIKSKKIVDAGMIYETYLNDYEMAVKVLIEGYCFKEAVFLAEKYKRPDVIVADVMPAVQSYCTNLVMRIRDLQNTFKCYASRLQKVRKEKVAKLKSFNQIFEPGDLADEPMNIQRDFDLYSDAGSQVTTRSTRTSGSRSSTLSSRNRRKEERKKQDLREGGVYEDIALIRALHGLIAEVFDMGPDVRKILILLVTKDLHDVAAAIQKLLKNLQTSMVGSFREIWPTCFVETHKCETIEETIVNENLLALDDKFRKPPQVMGMMNWEISVLNV